MLPYRFVDCRKRSNNDTPIAPIVEKMKKYTCQSRENESCNLPKIELMNQTITPLNSIPLRAEIILILFCRLAMEWKSSEEKSTAFCDAFLC